MNADEMRAFDERVRRVLGEESPVELRGGAQARRRRRGARLPAGRARRGRHPRRRPGGRGRHREPAGGARASRSRCEATAPERVSVRGEVALPIAAFERLNRARAGARARALRQPAQRGRRLAAPAPRHRRRAAARPRVPRLRARRGHARGPRQPGAGARAAGGLGLPREPGLGGLRRRRGGDRLPREAARGPRPAAGRDRRHGHQGEPPRPAGGARHAGALAALGDRLQVPAPAGDHRGRGDRGPASAARAR